MKAEISRFRYKDDQSFSGVYFKQGQHIQDSELNSITTYLKQQIENLGARAAFNGTPRRDGLIDIVEELGAPLKGWKARFRPAGGVVVADGVVAEALPRFKDAAFSIFNQKFLHGEYDAPKTAFVYVDIWDQIKDAYMLPDLIDPGLNGALGACISERVAQVKLCQSSDLAMDPEQCGTQLNLPKVGNGIFDIKLRTGAQLEDKCDPCADLVDISLTTSNLLFRVEVHDIRYDETGFPLEVLLKWSRENGAITYKVPPSGTALPQLDKSFAYEFFNEETEQNMGVPAGGYSHQPARGKIVTDPADRPQKATHYRRWDGFARIDLMTDALKSGWDRGVGLSKTAAGSEHGRFGVVKGAYVINLSEFVISLDLVDRDILVGDFWMALARSNAPEGEKIRVLSERPLGIHHHYCYLGELIMEEEDSYIRIDQPEDKSRLEFPDLTCLHASDISYMPHDCDKIQDVSNMQDALDALCQAIPEYHTLKMSCGTGQSGYLEETFASQIKVLVEDHHGRPVPNTDVVFSCIYPYVGTGPRPNPDTNIGRIPLIPVKDIPKIPIPRDVPTFPIPRIPIDGPRPFDPLVNPGVVRRETQETASEIELVQSRSPANEQDHENTPSAPSIRNLGITPTDLVHRNNGDVGAIQLTVRTDHMGYASVYWTPRSVEGPRMVRVELAHAPQGVSGVLFYCGFAEIRKPEKPILPKLKGVFWRADRKQYHNDNTVKLDRVLKGLELHFSDALRSGPDYRNAFRLFIDAVEENSNQNSNHSFIRTYEICSKFKVTENRLIVQPNQTILKEIAKNNKATDCLPRGFRFRIELDGRFIFTKSGQNFDAFVPTNPTSDNKFIALDWSEAGLGHISEFKSWFYLAINKPDPVKEVPINTVTKEELAKANLFNGNEAARLLEFQPHWERHTDIFKAVKISDRNRIADIQRQIVFDGYKPRPKKQDVFVNRMNQDELVKTKLFTETQLKKVLANQPHWENIEGLVKGLSITGTSKRQTLATRLNFADYRAKIPPVKKDVFVNYGQESEIRRSKLFSENELKIIMKNKPHWKDLKALASGLGLSVVKDIRTRDRLQILDARISFEGYSIPKIPKRDILVNKMNEDQLVSTRLFNRIQASEIVKNQPHWEHEKLLFEKLKITNSAIKAKLSPRLGFDGFRKFIVVNPRVIDATKVVLPRAKVIKPPVTFNPVLHKPLITPLPVRVDTRKKDVKVNIFNLDQLVGSGVFDKTEAAKILAFRPKWSEVKQVTKTLKITDATRISSLERRLNFEGFGRGVPVKETPKVSINKGTEKELLSVPGISSRTQAKKIMSARPYGKIEDLKKAGLRLTQINKMKPHLKL